MRLKKSMLPAPAPGTEWSLRQRGDSVRLRLRTKGLFGTEIGRWSTEAFSRLAPDPVTALTDVATQMVTAAQVEVEVAA